MNTLSIGIVGAKDRDIVVSLFSLIHCLVPKTISVKEVVVMNMGSESVLKHSLVRMLVSGFQRRRVPVEVVQYSGQGYAQARAYLLNVAQADFHLQMDSGTLLKDGVIDDLANALREEEECAWSVPTVVRISFPGDSRSPKPSGFMADSKSYSIYDRYDKEDAAVSLFLRENEENIQHIRFKERVREKIRFAMSDCILFKMDKVDTTVVSKLRHMHKNMGFDNMVVTAKAGKGVFESCEVFSLFGGLSTGDNFLLDEAIWYEAEKNIDKILSLLLDPEE